jgi:hypothetical protein
VGNPFGLLGGFPPSDDSAGTGYCNLRAYECSSGDVTCGERAVDFRGIKDGVIGFYFMSTPTGVAAFTTSCGLPQTITRLPFGAETTLGGLCGRRLFGLAQPFRDASCRSW